MEMIFLLVLLFFGGYVIRSKIIPFGKGKLGEYFVQQKLNKLNRKEYTSFHNIVLKIKGKTTQIDHVVVSNYGIFVIETKNYKGWIFGYENNKYWTQVIYKRKFKLYNPILQNRGHIYALQYYLKSYRSVPFVSMIVFSNRARLKTRTATKVIYINELNRQIKQYQRSVISDDVKNEIIEIIQSTQNPKKSKIGQNNHSESYGICPNCGGQLILRNGKYGEFIGCETFPDCRYSQSLRN